jgi:3-dehydroquinate dehydratase-2
MSRIQIINGPNLNLLGRREQEIYGKESFEDFLATLKNEFTGAEIGYFQSNIEGEIVDAIQKKGFECDAIVINPGGYSHTSVAIADAMKAVPSKVIEVHISNVFNREEFRRNLVTALSTDAFICGFGLEVYRMAITGIMKDLS